MSSHNIKQAEEACSENIDWFQSQWEARKVRNLKSEATTIVWTSRTFGMQPPECFWKSMKGVVWTLVNILTDVDFIPQGRDWRFYIRTAYCSMLLSLFPSVVHLTIHVLPTLSLWSWPGQTGRKVISDEEFARRAWKKRPACGYSVCKSKPL